MKEDISFSCQVRMDKGINPIRDDYHKTFEVYYLLKGTCWYFIGNKSYRLTAGDIALIPPGVIHGTSYETPTSSRVLFNCPESYLPASVRDLILQTPYFPYSQATRDQVEDIFQVIQKEYREQNNYWQDIVRSKVAELFVLIARNGRAALSQKQESPIVEKAAGYIKQHYMDPVNLQAVAEYCYVSREHLSRIFKKETGFGFSEYLNLFRMQKAHNLLEDDPHCQVAQVATQCGFNDSNYFSKQYKKHFGISPTKTRKTNT